MAVITKRDGGGNIVNGVLTANGRNVYAVEFDAQDRTVSVDVFYTPFASKVARKRRIWHTDNGRDAEVWQTAAVAARVARKILSDHRLEQAKAAEADDVSEAAAGLPGLR